MPYKIRKKGDQYEVVNTETNKVRGSHDSAEKAKKQLNLLRAVSHGWKPSKKDGGYIGRAIKK